ncbi:MAG: hypothetical protein ACW98Y_03675 [Candidatus Thorarchaeota archaeon]
MVDLKGRDLLCTQDWSVEELEKTLDLSFEMKTKELWNDMRYQERMVYWRR